MFESTATAARAPLDALTFEEVVNVYYQPLYKFAASLTGAESDACDLTQQTFYIFASKGHQLRDTSKVKTWLFTTLHREYLKSRRKTIRFPHIELSDVESELPPLLPETISSLDVATLLKAMAQVDEIYRAALALFYIDDQSYQEISAILGVPMGTVQSRIARGKSQLQQLLAREAS